MKIFITGASSGIGESLARHYASQGATLGLVARRSSLLNALASSLPVKSSVYALDVRDTAALAAAATDFMQKHGVPDVVIANAGVSRGTLTEHAEDVAAFKSVLETNVIGMVNTFQPFIQAMHGKGGSLVGIASVAGIRGLPGAGAYSASKAAAINYLESLRSEMQHAGVYVTTIAPGYIRTPMTAINDYAMPFMMPSDIAAKKFAKAISQKRRFVVIPWQMGIVAKLLRLLPDVVWDRITRHAPRKARIADQ